MANQQHKQVSFIGWQKRIDFKNRKTRYSISIDFESFGQPISKGFFRWMGKKKRTKNKNPIFPTDQIWPLLPAGTAINFIFMVSRLIFYLLEVNLVMNYTLKGDNSSYKIMSTLKLMFRSVFFTLLLLSHHWVKQVSTRLRTSLCLNDPEGPYSF